MILKTVEVGEYNEGMSWEILVNEEVTPSSPCPHAISAVQPNQISYRPVFLLPRGIKAYNEGGHNSTLLCLDCLLETIK